MVLRRALVKPLITIVVSSILIVSIMVVFSENKIVSETTDIQTKKTVLNKAIVQRTELSIHDAVDIIEIATRLPAIQHHPDASLISMKFKGISPDADTKRRQVMRAIYDVYGRFESVGFVMSNGDVYSIEPASLQQNLPRINFTDREYYKGVISTNKTFISGVFRSTATNHNTVVIASPVFVDSSLEGMLIGALDLQVISNALHNLELKKNELIVIVDKNGNQIASSSNPETYRVNELQSFSRLEGFSNAIIGKSGIDTERINGTLMSVSYSPINIVDNRWALLIIQPYDDAYSQVISSQNEEIIIIGVVLGIISTTGCIIFKALVENAHLNDKLEQANLGLRDLNKELSVKSEKLREVDKMKEEFSSMITHELKTPLVPIQGYSELLLDGTLGELTQKQQEKVRIIHDSVLHLSDLIQDILDVHKLELGKLKLDKQTVSAKEIIDRCIDTLKTKAATKGIDLTTSIQDNVSLQCDPKRILQVLNNLVGNSIKFVPEHTGRIEISIKNDSGYLVFSVKDNGIGIPKDKQQNLFKKFYQVDTSLNRKAVGTGLGLAISKGIVEAHKGKIWCESEEGKGSIFYFSIPMDVSD